MLNRSFYIVDKAEPGADGIATEADGIKGGSSLIEVGISLIKEHDVYKGHFPGMPVVPGVCQIQIVKEILCKGLEDDYILREMKMCKFSNMMNPFDVAGLKCSIKWSFINDEIVFSGELADVSRTYLKIKGILNKGHEIAT